MKFPGVTQESWFTLSRDLRLKTYVCNKPLPLSCNPNASSVVLLHALTSLLCDLAAVQRMREGAGAEEVKEEPDDTALNPTPMEVPMVNTLRSHGIPSDDAVQSLRLKGHNVQEALKHALRTLCERNNSRNEDMARYASEQDKEKLAATRRQEDMELTVLGDIAPRFQQVTNNKQIIFAFNCWTP